MTPDHEADNPSRTAGIHTTPIAIVGMASIFPNAKNLPEYWDNILRKIDCIIDVPPSRWKIEDYYDPDPTKEDKVYSKRGGFIPDVVFDPIEFGLPPNILEVTDVSQLLALVVARDALEDAGYGEGSEFDRAHTGVTLGVVGLSTKLYIPLMARLQYPVWEKVLRSAGISEPDTQRIIQKIKSYYIGWEENAFPGTIGNVIAGRIANRFDLGGSNCVVDAACASSLAAIKMAIDELTLGRASMMISGGLDTDNSIGSYICFSKTPAFTRGDHVRAFDADSDGMMVGEGLGMVVLKRLADAERDGDRIYAVIRGIGSSSDGRFKSIYAPRPSGQALALRRAYEDAGYEPTTVGLIEAHGTGTTAGDPAEFQGLIEVFGENNPQRQYIALGTVKSQIAHTKAAAGVASLIKTALALHHKVLPPTINVKRPNPKLGIENSPFYLNTETRPWIRAASLPPRRAGVSSFGFGGTNWHLTLEEYTHEHSNAYRVQSVPQAIILSAADPSQLANACKEALSALRAEDRQQTYNHLVDASKQAIPQTSARVGFLAASPDEAAELLELAAKTLQEKPAEESWENPKGIYYRKSGLDPKGKIVALFPGQGSQYVDMGRELAVNFPLVREAFAEMDELFLKDGRQPLSRVVYPIPAFDDAQKEQQTIELTRTENAQPAIGTLSVAMYKLLEQAGFHADFTAGHSFGELTALWAAGVLSDQDYYFLAKSRGQAMAAPDDPDFDAGGMLAIKGDIVRLVEEIKAFPDITLANYNSNNQVVLAGPKAAIAAAQQALTAKGFSAVPLTVSAAFHTSLVGHAQKPFAEAIKQAEFKTPKVAVYSNTSGLRYPDDPKSIRKILAEHMLHSVLFKDEIEAIYSEGGSIFIEIGPKSVLTNLVNNILEGKPHMAVALNASAKKDSDRQLREAVVQLRVAGLNLEGFDPYQAPRTVDKPRKKSSVAVTINAGLYMTEKTRSAFEKALNDGFKISAAAAPAAQATASAPSPSAAAPKPTEAARPMPAPPLAAPLPSLPSSQSTPKPTTPSSMTTNHSDHNYMSEIMRAMEATLAQFQTHQTETQRVHEQYLQNEAEYAKIFSNLAQMEMGVLSSGNASQAAQVMQGLERSLMRFHDHQDETLRVHEKYLGNQSEFSRHFIRLIQQQYDLLERNAFGQNSGNAAAAPASPLGSWHAEPQGGQAAFTSVPQEVAPTNGNGNNGNGYQPQTQAHTEATAVAATPAPTPAIPVTVPAQPSSQVAASAISTSALQTALLEIVSEKTGYPSEMLELSMDMEADLGIDSIKRVEILGAMQERFPTLPKIDASALSEMRTLGQVVEYMAKSLGEVAATASIPAEATIAAPTVNAATPSQKQTAVGIEQLQAALLEVVSEKTGYPSEMLELNMDMEADLGIDSIKRVEILGAMQERFPALPKADSTALSEMRTLGQVVEYMVRGADTVSSVATPPDRPEAPAAEAPTSTATATTVTSAPASRIESGSVDPEQLQAALLEVVSEKTGYPSEMLELNMDMEADLGIDSIKRVEILGAMQERFPALPKADSTALSEMRTLGQVVEYLGQNGNHNTQPQAASVESRAPTAVSNAIPQGMLRVKPLPVPDTIDLGLPEAHICLITDDGTPLTDALAGALANEGAKVVVLSLPRTVAPQRSALREGIDRVELENLNEVHLRQTLEKLQSTYGQVGAFVHLDPPASKLSDGNIVLAESESIIVKTIFLIAKHLKESLVSAAAKGRGIFAAVTRLDGNFGLSGSDGYDPVSGGLFGLVKTLSLEWENVFCRAIDLNPGLSVEQAAQAVAAELHDPNRLLVEVAYGPQGRVTLAVEPSGDGAK